MNNKPLKVSDWSQKYKLAIYAISGVGIIVGMWKVLAVLNSISQNLETIISLLK